MSRTKLAIQGPVIVRRVLILIVIFGITAFRTMPRHLRDAQNALATQKQKRPFVFIDKPSKDRRISLSTVQRYTFIAAGKLSIRLSPQR